MKLKTKIAAILALSCMFSTQKGFLNDVQLFVDDAVPAIATSLETKGSASALAVRAKAAYLMDYHTKTVLYGQNETKRLPIASMCKIMTLLLCFDAIKQGSLCIDEEITVSEKAASMGGSQVFLEAYGKYPVSELIKSIVVCSANDSCVAMAEKIAGSQALFVEKMNQKAQELQMSDTLFSNCTGLPQDPQYSCAKDVAIMLKELLSHEQYYEFGKVWTQKFNHPKGRQTEITNTNKLIRFYDGCDGGKTGFTNEAGFCLAATAKRDGTRVISVVIGAENSSNRFEDTKMLFDYAFANYQTLPIVEAGVSFEEKYAVNGGKEKELSVMPLKSIYSFTKKGEKNNLDIEINLKELYAPIQSSEKVGELVVYKDGIEIDKTYLLAAEDVEKASWSDRLQDIARNWNG